MNMIAWHCLTMTFGACDYSGYLPPEYIIDGAYSTKSDVFSYGVLILEIVSGKRNKGFCHQDNLLAHVRMNLKSNHL